MNVSAENPIGVFDSGVGGLSTLRALWGALPHEDFIYLADFNHAPYGGKTDGEILERVNACADTLLSAGAKAIVVACNTATAVGIDALRRRLTVPVIGTEPAVKPACAAALSVLVLLTPAAARQPRFRTLLARYPDRRIEVLATPTLACDVERHLFDPAALRCITFRILSSAPKCDAVVLGCTHYVFLRPYVEQFYGGTVPVFDGNDGVARHLTECLDERNLRNNVKVGSVRFLQGTE